MLIERHVLNNYLRLENNVDITDPCYDRDVWCRMTVTNMKPGDYRCSYYLGAGLDEAGIAEAKESYRQIKSKCYIKRTEAEYIADWEEDIKGRCFIIEIQLKGRHFDIDSRQWTEIGNIGVDAGLAGFFPDKPDFNDNEWTDFCSRMPIGAWTFFEEGLGFWSRSGYGDGSYDVYAIEEEGKTIALKICF